MGQRLYYTDSFLYEFDGRVLNVTEHEDSSRRMRPAVILDQTAFYPSSGGQPFDTGTLQSPQEPAVRVIEVAEDNSGRVLHLLESLPACLSCGSTVHGKVDVDRRRDHMQQHSGQHVLSAAFVRLFKIPTVSFHLGDESSTIDLETAGLQSKQLSEASQLANQVVMEDRPVAICFADAAEARARGVRKLPETAREKLRLIDIEDFDVTACGGTHVRSTGQIGPILLRKMENVKQGVRVEFVCGVRALATAQRDFNALTEAAAIFSAHIWQVPELARRSQEDAKGAAKSQQKLQEELAELYAREWARDAPVRDGVRVVIRVIADRDLSFTKLLAQKIATQEAVALLASTAGSPALVFAQSPGLRFNLSQIMKRVATELGGRGGGSKDFAHGGIPDATKVLEALERAERLLTNDRP